MDKSWLCSAAADRRSLRASRMLTVWALPGAYGAVAAARDGNESKVEVLLEQDPSLLNTSSLDLGWTPLTAAACGGHVTLVEWLLDRGATRDLRDHGGCNALQHACAQGRVGVVSLLLERGADPRVWDGRGLDCLMLASSEGKAGVIRQLLAWAGADDAWVERRSFEGKKTPLSLACAGGHVEAAVVLMGLGGADPTGTLVGEGSEKMWKLARSLKHAGVVELMEELGMAWHLYRARDVVDGVDAVTKAAAHHHSLTLSAAQESTGAQTGGDVEGVQRARLRMSPDYLWRRVKEGELLPEISLSGAEGHGDGGAVEEEEEEEEEEVLRRVVEYVVWWMKRDVFEELMDLLRRRRKCW